MTNYSLNRIGLLIAGVGMPKENHILCIEYFKLHQVMLSKEAKLRKVQAGLTDWVEDSKSR